MIATTAIGGLFNWTHAVGVTSGIEATPPVITDKAFFDVLIDGVEVGRITFGLYGDVVPLTVRNFAQICDEGVSSADGTHLGYTGSPFHRIIPDFMVQGGDITTGNGTGGESIFGGVFKDENFDINFTKPYQLAMANAGPNTNRSQFFITLTTPSWLNGHHVVFGEVIDGKDIVDQLENIGTQSGAPTQTAIIANSGPL